MYGIPNSITIVNTTPVVYEVEEAASFLPWWDAFLSLCLVLSPLVANSTRLCVQGVTLRATVSLVFSGCKEQKTIHLFYYNKCFLCCTLDKTTKPVNWVAHKDKGMLVYTAVQCQEHLLMRRAYTVEEHLVPRGQFVCLSTLRIQCPLPLSPQQRAVWVTVVCCTLVGSPFPWV